MTAAKLRAFDADGRTIDDPTDTEVHDLFADLNAATPFAIVERVDREPVGQHYFQIHLDYVGNQDLDTDVEPEVEYEVEFRDGGPDRHYHARIGDEMRFVDHWELLNRAYRAWHAEDPGLHDILPWVLRRFDS